MGAIALVVGIIGLGAVIAVVAAVFVAIRSRRNTANGGPVGVTYPQNMGYPPQQAMPSAQPPYPAPAPNQGYGYPAPPAQTPQEPNPYTQHPPPQGR